MTDLLTRPETPKSCQALNELSSDQHIRKWPDDKTAGGRARTAEVAESPFSKMGPMTATDTPKAVFVRDDGGRAEAGYSTTNDAGDCACRALSIAAELPYQDVYDGIAAKQAEAGYRRSARDGVKHKVMREVMVKLGWVWTPTMHIGQGCTVHLRADELPRGRLVVQVSKHWCAVIDGVIHDTHDPSRDGTRCVYGYWQRGRDEGRGDG